MANTAKETDAASCKDRGGGLENHFPDTQGLWWSIYGLGSRRAWTQPPSSLGNCITLLESGAASIHCGAGGGGLWGEPTTARGGWECGFYPLLSMKQMLCLLGTWQLSSHSPGWWGQEGLAHKISFGKILPGTESLSSCHQQRQADTAWLPSHHWSTAPLWVWEVLPSLPLLQDTLVRANIPGGVQGLCGTLGSSIPHPSSSVPPSTVCMPCRGGCSSWTATHPWLIARLLPHPLRCTAEPWKRKRRTRAEPHY